MIAPNTILQGRYMVRNQIGAGGMGAVYIATDQRFGSTVALKETFFTDPSLRKAFEREAHLLNSLRHAALPRVSDHFIEEEGQFIVMEFIPGDDLARMLAERGAAFPVKDVMGWADQLLDALDYLHTQEPAIIHRDIKPQNLKLMPRGQIILLDFGLAKGSPVHMTKVTATGSVFGYSRHYAPLEQIQGTGTDPRSDLYSLAATLYHLMTGTTPVDALTRATAVLNNQPDPLVRASEANAQVPDAVAEVLASALALNSGQRPQSAVAMREALREAGEKSSASARETVAQAALTLAEQETQLIGGGTAGTPEPAGDRARKTNPVTHDAATLVGPAALTASDKAQPTGVEREADDKAADAREAASVVTKVKAGQTAVEKPFLSRQAMGIAASVLLLLVIAAAVYTFTRGGSQNSANTAPPPNSNTDAATAPPANQNAEAASAPSVVATPLASPEAEAAANRSTPRTVAPVPRKAAENGRAQTDGQANTAAPVVNPNAPTTPTTPERPARDTLTPAERRAQRQRAVGDKVRRQMDKMRRREQRRRGFPPPY